MGKEAKKTAKKDNRPAEDIPKKNNSFLMGKKLLILFIAATVIGVIGMIFVLSTTECEAKAELNIDYGIVQINHAGEWFQAENGTLIYQSDVIKTGKNTSATVILFKNSIIRLDSNTEITLEKIIEEGGDASVSIKQDAGRTWSTVLKISGIDDYEVQTPTTVASVRGTSFDVYILPNGTTDVGVSNGTVNISSKKNDTILNSIIVTENQSVEIQPQLIDKPLETKAFEEDEWVIINKKKDGDYRKKAKNELYTRIDPYLEELKETYGVSDEELEILIDGYLKGLFDLPPETPDHIRQIIESG